MRSTSTCSRRRRTWGRGNSPGRGMKDRDVALRAACCLGLLLAAATARADAPTSSEAPAAPHASIHQLELEHWKLEEAQGWMPPGDREMLRVSPRVAQVAVPTREVHGYHPYWMGTSYLGYDWSLLTSVAFFALELDGTGAVTNAHGWPWTGLVSTAHDHGVRVLVTAAVHSGTQLGMLLGSSTNRQAAIGSIVSAAVAGGADGASVDFEGVPGSSKQALVDFMGALRTALRGAIPGAYLSIATPAVDWSNAFDYDSLAARCDHLMVMGYDYHSSGSTTTGPVAPLAGWGTYNVAWTIADYIRWGAPRNKILLGVPYYGYRWPSASGAAGATTTGTGTALQYASVAQEADALGKLWDAPSSTPWYREQTPQWRQGWFEDEQSLGAKYARVLSEDLAGVGIWALGYDGTRPELWGALADAFRPTTSVATHDLREPLRCEPNPFRDAISFRLGTMATPAKLTIYDVNGRLVRELAPGATMKAAFRWDGRDAAGRVVASGIYVVRFTSGSETHTGRIVRLN